MFIQTEETPNPNSLKFLPERPIMGDLQPVTFHKNSSVSASPLAAELLAIDGVESVFLSKDFITITKEETIEWFILKPLLLGTMIDFFLSGEDIFLENTQTEGTVLSDDPIIQKIMDVLNKNVRPAVAQDGGDIVFHSFENGILKLEMKGACSGCPSSTATLKSGIENLMRHYVPEVESVEQVL